MTPGSAADLSSRSAASLLPYAVLAALLAALLAVHIDAPWQYLHDDNGRRYSSYARSHLTLGLSTTHARDFFYDPRQRTLVPYGHHPPGLSLLLAGWFCLCGSSSPFAARVLPALFHLLSAILVLAILREHYAGTPALLGGLAFAIVPMSSFFGKLVNFEPFVLPFSILVVTTYSHWAEDPAARSSLLPLALVPVAALVDWMILLALLTVVADAGWRFLRGEGRCFLWFSLLGSCVGLATFAAIAGWLATGPAGLYPLASSAIIRTHLGEEWTAGRWLKALIRYNHWYFTRPLHYASLLMPLLLIREARHAPHLSTRTRLIALFGLAGVLPVLLFPGGSYVHAYWQFYLLPYAVLSFACVLDAASRHLRPRLWRWVSLGVGVWLLAESAYILTALYETPDAYVSKTLASWQAYL